MNKIEDANRAVHDTDGLPLGESRMNLYRVLQSACVATVRNLGRCPHCMRKSFVAAAIAAASLVIVSQWPHEALVTIPLGVVTAALIVLWMAHLAMFSLRRARAAKVAGAHAQPDASRRSFLPTFAKALAVAALCTALPELARAEDACERCISNRSKCQDNCGDVSDNPDPEAHRQWERCNRQCRDQYDCSDPCENPSDDPDESSGNDNKSPPPKNPPNRAGG